MKLEHHCRRRPMGAVWVLAACVFVLGGMPVGAQSENPHAAFSSLFPDAKVRGTREDLTWAAKVLEAAAALKDDPALRRVCYEKAYELAAGQVDGALTAVTAMEAMQRDFPDTAGKAGEQILAVLEKHYPSAKGPQKAELAERYLRELEALADAKLQAYRSEEALALYRKALPVAKAVGPQEAEQVQRAIQEATARQAIERKVIALREKLQAESDDQATLRELAVVVTAELDAPDEAARWTGRLQDEPFKRALNLAAKPMASLTEEELLELGAWYQQIARSPGLSPMGRAGALVRGKFCYTRHQAVHTAEDGSKLRARLALDQVDKAIATSGLKPEELQRLVRKYHPTAGPRDPQVAQYIQKLVAKLYEVQNKQGNWELDDGTGRHQPGGQTALVVYALLLAGEDPGRSPKLNSGLKYLVECGDLTAVYAVCLRVEALGQAPGGAGRYRKRIQNDAEMLLKGMGAHGLFTYHLGRPAQGGCDLSCSQFGWMGLNAASAEAGVAVPAKAWAALVQTLIRSQNDDGGFPYRAPTLPLNPNRAADAPEAKSTASMTCAALNMLLMAEGHVKDAATRKGLQKALDGGYKWLEENWQRERWWGGTHGAYQLLGVQRVGLQAGRRTFGDLDWYEFGCKRVIESNPVGRSRLDLPEVAMSLIFLCRGSI